MAGPRGFEPRIPGCLCRNSEGLHDLPGLCVLILARLRAQLSLEGYLLKYSSLDPGPASLKAQLQVQHYGIASPEIVRTTIRWSLPFEDPESQGEPHEEVCRRGW